MSNVISQKWSAITVVLVSGTGGPAATHVPLGPEAGLSRHDESYAVAPELHTVPKPFFQQRRGLLHPEELTRLEDAVRLSLGLL